MATALRDRKLAALLEKTAAFAAGEIACDDNLSSTSNFPLDIWLKMGRAGLLGLNLPVAYGGGGKSHLHTVAAAEIMVRRGHNPGIVFSWLYHLVVAHLFIVGFANAGQREQYLPGLAAGQITACLAVSEPGTGAHPKHIKTTAYRQGGNFVLNGEKDYLTNGPIADLFIVVAQTGVQNHRKEFTAFLVPRETTGLTLTGPLDFQFLKPAPHGGVRLDNCRLTDSQVLGTEGAAYQDMVVPFREWEDVYIAGLFTGGAARQLQLLTDLLKQHYLEVTDELAGEIAGIQSSIHTLRVLAYEMAAMLDNGEKHPEFPYLLPEFKTLAGELQNRVRGLVGDRLPEGCPGLDRVSADLTAMVQIAGRITLLKQVKLGKELLSRSHGGV